MLDGTLSAYDDLSIFKIYLSDIGLLRRLAKLPASSLLGPSAAFTEFKGAFAENYVLQSLKTQFEVPLRYLTYTGNGGCMILNKKNRYAITYYKNIFNKSGIV